VQLKSGAEVQIAYFRLGEQLSANISLKGEWDDSSRSLRHDLRARDRHPVPGQAGPLFQLLYSALLMSARISAANAAKALVEACLTTPERMAQVMLGNTAELLIGKYNSDLRKLRDEAERDVKRER